MTLSPTGLTALVMLFWLLFTVDPAAQGSVATDRTALEALYDVAGGDDWTESRNWKSSLPLGEWHGVTTGADGRVTRLSLAHNALRGRIPAELGNMTRLQRVNLSRNALRGRIPAELGNMTRLWNLNLGRNDLSGPIPSELANLTFLRHLTLAGNWGLTGTLPAGLRVEKLEALRILLTQLCAPVAWRNWLLTMRFKFAGRLCGTGADVTIDVAVFYTPAGREAAGGTVAIETEIDLMIAEANQAYETSGVHHRLALAETSPVSYTETGDSHLDLARLEDLSDGYMDAIHVRRDGVGADLVHLVVGRSDVGGIAVLSGAFSLGLRCCFAHELGHNMGLLHERYLGNGIVAGSPHPAYGYVNQHAFDPSGLSTRCWKTIMAYGLRCREAGLTVHRLSRFSNPRQHHDGDPLGVPYGTGSGLTGPADAAAVLNATGPAVSLWRDPPPATNRSPIALSTPQDLTMAPDSLLDISSYWRLQPFFDPNGDDLTYTVSSSAPNVVTGRAEPGWRGPQVLLTAVGAGTATIHVAATDPGGLSAAVSLGVRVLPHFTDHPIVPGQTPVKAVHFTELRGRIDSLRVGVGLERFAWTDPVLTAGKTPVRRVHVVELRSALRGAYVVAVGSVPQWVDAIPPTETTRIKAVHLLELRAAVIALECYGCRPR